MRVFITGATGHIGSVVVPELLRAGHEVHGLARSDEGAAGLRALGAHAVRGSLSDHDILRSAAVRADAVLHLALFDTARLRAGDGAGAAAAGIDAVRAMGEALEGIGTVLVSVSAVGALGELGHVATEEDAAPAVGPAAIEHAVLGFADRGVQAQIVRLPLVTHSRPSRPGLVGGIIAAARRSGRSGIAGDGANRWPATHSLDVASLLRLVLERGDTGRRWHAIAEEGIPVRAIAERIGERLGLPVATIPDEQLQQHFGFVGDLIGSDVPAASSITREELGWAPAGPSLLDDLAADDFFR